MSDAWNHEDRRVPFVSESAPGNIKLLASPSISRPSAVAILSSPEIMADFFQTELSWLLPKGAILRECRPKVLRDRLGSRQVVSYRLFFERAEHKPLVYVLKRYADKAEGKKIFFIMRLLWENGFNHQGKFRIPEPHFYLEELGIQVQERAAGMLLRKNLNVRGPIVLTRMKAVARWLAKLHHLDADVTKIRAHADEAISIRDFVHEVGSREHRLFFPRLVELAELILTKLSACGNVPLAPVHGDFQCENIYVDTDEVTVVDFDRFCRSDPARDAGYLIAQMRAMAFLGGGALGSVHAGLRAFWEEYLAAAPVAERESLSARTTLFAARKCLQNIFYMAYVLPGEGMEIVSVLLNEAERFSRAERVEDVLDQPISFGE